MLMRIVDEMHAAEHGGVIHMSTKLMRYRFREPTTDCGLKKLSNSSVRWD